MAKNIFGNEQRQMHGLLRRAAIRAIQKHSGQRSHLGFGGGGADAIRRAISRHGANRRRAVCNGQSLLFRIGFRVEQTKPIS